MKKILILLLSVLALALPGAAQARPGQLDRSFGVEGRVTTRVGTLPLPTNRSHFAWAGGGRIVAAVDSHLVEYLPDGRLNKRFGTGGRVEVESIPDSSFSLTGLAVDSEGRILVSGTVSKIKPGDPGEAESAAAMVRRFQPNGELDRSFGREGTALNDFGFPHPLREGTPKEFGPFVKSSGLLVDAADRPVLTGSWLSYSPSPCYSLYCYSTSRPFIARLDEDGSLDSSFGTGGVFGGSPEEQASTPTRVGEHILFITAYIGCVDRCGGSHPELGRLDGTGNLDPNFGSSGLTELPFSETPTLAVDRSGRILAIGSNWESGSFPLQRLSPRGIPSNRFGEEGIRWINLPKGSAQGPKTLAVDRHGRPVFAIDARRAHRNYIVLLRRNPRGGRDRGFGNNGQSWTRVPGSISPSQVLIGGNGKIVVGGNLALDGGPEVGFGLVRYLGR